MSNVCLICYCKFSRKVPKYLLPCPNFSFCNDCLTSWTIEQISTFESFDVLKDQISCPHARVQKISLSQILSLLSQEQKVKIYDSMTKKYCQSSSDIRCCPNPKCNNYGFLPPKPCDELLRCSACKREWENVSQYSLIKKTKVVIGRSLTFKNNELCSLIFEALCTKNCPHCDIYIQKNGGCQHMTCKHCNYQFCWNCNQQWGFHNQALCSGWSISLTLIILTLCVLFVNKTGIMLPMLPILSFIWVVFKFWFRCSVDFFFTNTFILTIVYFGYISFNFSKTFRNFKSALSIFFAIFGPFCLAILIYLLTLYIDIYIECYYFGLGECIFVGIVWILSQYSSYCCRKNNKSTIKKQ